MSWPFSNVAAPNFDSGFANPGAAGANTFGAVPNSPSGAQWLMGLHVDNGSAAEVTVSLRDASSNGILTSLVIPANTVIVINWPFMPATGALQWACSAASGVDAKLWGYS